MVSKATRAYEKVSGQRLKAKGGAAAYLLTIVFFLAGERGVNEGENEGRLERRNGRMRVFIGSRVAGHFYSWYD